MASERENLFERITQKREELGLSERALSIAATGKPDVIRDIKRGKGMPNAAVLGQLATVLGTTSDWLLGRAEGHAPLTSEAVLRDAPTGWRGADRDGIPVLATGYCDDLHITDDGSSFDVERVQLELDQVVRYVQRPAYLWNARDAYAIDLLGDSMEPVLPQGSVRLVDPRRAPAPGDDVVVQLTDGNGGSDIVTVLVKRLVRATSAYIELRQFNPAITFRVPRRQVARLHRIVSYDELLN